MPMPAAAPPTPWSPSAPDCPLAWTIAWRRKLCPRRGSALPVTPASPAEAWNLMSRHFQRPLRFFQQPGRDISVQIEGLGARAPGRRAEIARACERLWEPDIAEVTEAPPPADLKVEAAALGVLSWIGQEEVEASAIDYWAGTAGLSFALEALHGSVELRAGGSALLQPVSNGVDRFSLLGHRPAWERLRHLLAVAGEAEWTAALATAQRLRAGAPLRERIPLSFLFPDVLEWGEADAREALADPQPAVWLGCLAFCVRDGALLERFVAAGRDSAEALGRYTGVRYEVAGAAFSLVEGAGPGAVAALILLLDQTLHGKHISLADDRRACAEALALLPDAAAFAALVDRLDVKEVAAAAVAFARRLPRIALAPLAGQVAQGSGGLAAASLLASLAGSEASLVDELLPGLPAASRQAVETARGRGGSGLREATPKELPAVLARPPWSQLTASHKKKAAALAPLALEPLPFEESAVWEDGERERWLDTVPRHSLFGSAVSRFAEKLWKSVPYADRSHNAHPQRWLAQQSAPAVIGVLVEATAALPEEGIGMCLPFRSPRLAPVVARALFRVPRVRAAARRWLSRHAECAAVALIPPAMGPAGKEREEAEAALRELARQGNQEIVTSVAAHYGEYCDATRAAVQALLSADPLSRLPAKLPKMPAFWAPASLTRLRLRGVEAVLPLAAVEALGTMLAFSPLGDPYAGLAQVREACDPASLSRFALDLLSAWLSAGAPSKEAWACHALAALGDDDGARRLGALVGQDWPAAGEHNRAIAGLDVLEFMGSEAALLELHRISQKGETWGIRDRAARKIESVALERGLSPEALEDLLLPTFDLDSAGSLELSYGSRAFHVGFDESLRPFVLDADGKRLKDLPKPGAGDDPSMAESAVTAWKELRKEVKRVADQCLRRLEQAMCTRRRWDAAAFQVTQARHPLASHLARRLVWGAWDSNGSLLGTFRLCEDGTLADAADDPWQIPDGARIGLPHRLDLDDSTAAAWAQLLADYEILQPFPQIGRPVFRLAPDERGARELSRWAGLRVPTGKLLGLEARGWKRGTPQHGPVSCWIDRPVAGPRRVLTVEVDPGIVNGAPLEIPEQTTVRAALVHADDRSTADLVVGDLDPLVISELLRDLESLR